MHASQQRASQLRASQLPQSQRSAQRHRVDNDVSFARAFAAAAVAPPPIPAAPRRYGEYDDVQQPQWLTKRARLRPICVELAMRERIAFGNKAKANELFAGASWTLTHTMTDGAFYGRGAHPGIIGIATARVDEMLRKFYAEMAMDIDAIEQGFGRRLFFSETGPVDAEAVTVMFFDMDCYLRVADPTNPPAEQPNGLVFAQAVQKQPNGLVFAQAVQKHVADLYTDASAVQCVVAATPPVEDAKHGGVKVGVHLYWPNLLVTIAQHRAVRRYIVKHLMATVQAGDLLAGWVMTANWADVLDFKVIGRRNLRMIGSDKLEPCKCAKEQRACDHLKPKPSAVKGFKFNPTKRYRLLAVLDNNGQIDDAATEQFRANTFELLCSVSLCLPRVGPATPCTIDPSFAADEMGLEEGIGEDDEETVTWMAYDSSNAQHMRVLNVLLRHIYVHCADREVPDAERLDKLVDRSPNGFQIGTLKHSRKHFYKLLFADGRPCMNRVNADWTSKAHSTERPYYFLDADGSISIRCGCRCADTQGRRTLGTLRAMQCSRSQFAMVQFGPIGLLQLLPHESVEDQRAWEKSAKNIFAARTSQHPDYFCADRAMDNLDNLIRTTSAINHIRGLRPAFRWSTGVPALVGMLQRTAGPPIEGNGDEAAVETAEARLERLLEMPTAHRIVAPPKRRANGKKRKNTEQ